MTDTNQDTFDSRFSARQLRFAAALFDLTVWAAVIYFLVG
jgi:hypothetical protein